MSYRTFAARTVRNGHTIRESKKNDAIRLLQDEFENDPSYHSQMYKWIAGNHPKKGDSVPIRLYYRRHSEVNGNIVKFTTPISYPVKIGDYLYDELNDEYFICTESFNVNQIQWDGKLTQCNLFLRWQNKDDEILEYPCYDRNTTQYNSGETGSRDITIGSSQHMALVQKTSDTLALHSPIRFFISADYTLPYKVTQNDSVTNNFGTGICNITFAQDELSPNDRIDLGICDYREPKKVNPPRDHVSNTDTPHLSNRPLISGNTTLLLYTKQTYTCNTDVLQWSVTPNKRVKLEQAGRTCTLYTDNTNLIDSALTLYAKTENTVTEMKIMVDDIL